MTPRSLQAAKRATRIGRWKTRSAVVIGALGGVLGGVLGLWGSLLVGCVFDESGIAPPDGNGVIDAGPVDGGPPPGDAGDCPDDVHLELSVGGRSETLPPDVPYVLAVPGDIVELSARGSCGRLGAISYEWQISPIDGTRATAAPDLVSETIAVYPVLPKDYTVALTVRSGDASATRSVLGIRVAAWQRHDNLPGNPDVRSLALSDDTLFVAHSRGVHRSLLGIAPGQDQFFDLAAEVQGSAPGNDLGVAHYDARGPSLWLAQEARRSGLWAIDLSDPQMPISTLVDYGTLLGGTAQVFDIVDHRAGIAIATERGVATSDADNGPFVNVFTPPDTIDVRALVDVADQLWAGSRQLYRFEPTDAPLDPYAGTAGADVRIRALAVDPDRAELWVASDGNGAARLDLAFDNAPTISLYNNASGALEFDRIHDLAIERMGSYAGDVWIATSDGVARYIRERDTWLVMDANHGLTQRTTLGAVAIDERFGRRVIYAGARGGLVSLRP